MKTLALLFLAVPAFASALTDPVPVISTACTVGGVSVTCGSAGMPMIYGSENVGADTSFSMTGLGTNTGITIIATAAATAGTVVSGVFCTWGSLQFKCGDSSAGATVSLDFLASTDGPQRLGLATYLVATDTEKGGAYDSIGGLGSCQFADCVSHGILAPFELGVPFEITLSLHSQSGIGFPTPLTGAGSFAEIQLQLFEANGTPVAIFDPPAPIAVPEPASWILSLVALLGISVTSLDRRGRSGVYGRR